MVTSAPTFWHRIHLPRCPSVYSRMSCVYVDCLRVERETGIGKDTLRAWERRYGFSGAPRATRRACRGYPRALVRSP